MTLPASGTITLSQVSTEVGYAANTQMSLSWVSSNSKDALKAMNGLYGRGWYQKTNAGNCNNGNCTANCNCGNIQCRNCVITGGVNCVNCDSRAWLQANCNCACTYNCTYGAVTYNCDCNCYCDCGDGGA